MGVFLNPHRFATVKDFAYEGVYTDTGVSSLSISKTGMATGDGACVVITSTGTENLPSAPSGWVSGVATNQHGFYTQTYRKYLTAGQSDLSFSITLPNDTDTTTNSGCAVMYVHTNIVTGFISTTSYSISAGDPNPPNTTFLSGTKLVFCYGAVKGSYPTVNTYPTGYAATGSLVAPASGNGTVSLYYAADKTVVGTSEDPSVFDIPTGQQWHSGTGRCTN